MEIPTRERKLLYDNRNTDRVCITTLGQDQVPTVSACPLPNRTSTPQYGEGYIYCACTFSVHHCVQDKPARDLSDLNLGMYTHHAHRKYLNMIYSHGALENRNTRMVAHHYQHVR